MVIYDRGILQRERGMQELQVIVFEAIRETVAAEARTLSEFVEAEPRVAYAGHSHPSRRAQIWKTYW